jgi:hypothetical protein
MLYMPNTLVINEVLLSVSNNLHHQSRYARLIRLSQRDDLTIEECHLRVDWQTLRRLPLSGAVVFN